MLWLHNMLPHSSSSSCCAFITWHEAQLLCVTTRWVWVTVYGQLSQSSKGIHSIVPVSFIPLIFFNIAKEGQQLDAVVKHEVVALVEVCTVYVLSGTSWVLFFCTSSDIHHLPAAGIHVMREIGIIIDGFTCFKASYCCCCHCIKSQQYDDVITSHNCRLCCCSCY